MSQDSFVYRYPPLQPGVLIKRYKRFMADIELDSGEVVTAHCPNTGPMTGVCIPGNRVQVSKSDNPKRKLAYTWEMIELCVKPAVSQKGMGAACPKDLASPLGNRIPTWVGVNTALPNRVVKLALEQRCIPELNAYEQIRSEVPYGADKKSRIDFLLTAGGAPDSEKSQKQQSGTEKSKTGKSRAGKSETRQSEKQIYVEVKNTTWAQGELALFPDTVTTRGQKHLRELMDLPEPAQAVMLYFINRGDCLEFSPGDSADLIYGQLLREAIQKGVTVLPCRFEVSPEGIRYLGLATLKL